MIDGLDSKTGARIESAINVLKMYTEERYDFRIREQADEKLADIFDMHIPDIRTLRHNVKPDFYLSELEFYVGRVEKDVEELKAKAKRMYEFDSDKLEDGSTEWGGNTELGEESFDIRNCNSRLEMFLERLKKYTHDRYVKKTVVNAIKRIEKIKSHDLPELEHYRETEDLDDYVERFEDFLKGLELDIMKIEKNAREEVFQKISLDDPDK